MDTNRQANNKTPGKVGDNGSQGNGGMVPNFDLAEDIMAHQRSITAVRRKSPAEKEIHKTEPLHINKPTAEPQQPADAVNQAIAEIVAKDIERLCKQNGMAGGYQ